MYFNLHELVRLEYLKGMYWPPLQYQIQRGGGGGGGMGGDRVGGSCICFLILYQISRGRWEGGGGAGALFGTLTGPRSDDFHLKYYFHLKKSLNFVI